MSILTVSHAWTQGNFKSNECMRQVYESLFNKYSVDIVLQGHSHAYERSYPVVGLGGAS